MNPDPAPAPSGPAPAPRLRLYAVIGLGLAAIAGSAVLAAADGIGGGSLWPGHALVSAVPLLLVTGAITSMAFVASPGARQAALRLVAAAAFAAWGLSQMARSPQLAGVLDDLAILLFVIDAAVAVVPEARARLTARRQPPIPPSGTAASVTTGVTGDVTMIAGYMREALPRPKTVRGHVDGVIGRVEAEVHCPDLFRAAGGED